MTQKTAKLTLEYSSSLGYFEVPRNSMCSQKWARPSKSSGSHNDPTEESNKNKYFSYITFKTNFDL